MQSPIDAAIAIQSDFNSPSISRDASKPSSNSTVCQCQETKHSRRAYLRLNKKYKLIMRKVRVDGFNFFDEILASIVTNGRFVV